ncbi:MAG: TIGR04282 family arsenosugar biosynthesis glycosyltransferase [Aquabacterium sp.]
MTHPRTAVVVMAKAPRAGFAKTRLAPALGAEGAARLARRMLDHTLRAALASGMRPCLVSVSPQQGDPAFAPWRHWPGLTWFDQPDGDLGQRMAHALDLGLQHAGRAVLVGTDAPALDADYLRAAAAALADHDAVLGPTADGGYVLLGLASPLRTLFQPDMPWSTASVMPQTRQRLAAAGARWLELPVQHDVDLPQDLARVPPGWIDAPDVGSDSIPPP